MKNLLFFPLFILSASHAAASGLPVDCDRWTKGLNVEYVCESLDREGAYAVFTSQKQGMMTTGNRQGFHLLANSRRCNLISRFTVTRDYSVPLYGTKHEHPMILRDDSDASGWETAVTLQAGGYAEFRKISTGDRERMNCGN